MAGAKPAWGITPPVTISPSTDTELILNEKLLAELKKQNNFEAPEETQNRCALRQLSAWTFLTHV